MTDTTTAQTTDCIICHDATPALGADNRVELNGGPAHMTCMDELLAWRDALRHKEMFGG